MKIINKLKNHYIAKCNYIKYVEKLPINDQVILLESQQGKEFGGNVYYIAKELVSREDYKSFTVYLCVNKDRMAEAKRFYRLKGLESLHLVECHTKDYYKLVASAKYLVSDNTFLPFFIKKEGQIYLNTWHGTPLKSLGKRINNDLHNIGNAQKNFVASDYLLYPNEYTKEHMVEDYMLENISSATYFINGYPRNTAFFDDNLKLKIKKKYHLEDKKIIAYMPTWRGTLSNKNNPIFQSNIYYILEEFESNLTDNQILYVNLHPIESASVDFSLFSKVKPFPSEYETYEFLNIADVLISDYSSVFFDFLNTRKKIILYTYDKEDYVSSRGLYRSLESFPFPIVDRMSEVIREINLPKNYSDEELISEFCPYDDQEATHKLCQKVFLNKNVDMIEGTVQDNHKENIFIYAGRLANNGITASLKNLLNNIDKEKRNYYLVFSSKDVKNNLDVVREITKDIQYYSFKEKSNLKISQKFVNLFYKMKLIKTNTYMKMMGNALGFELKRIFADARIDAIIQFSGYSYQRINLFSQFKGNKIIYVHANMLEEINLRNNQRRDVLEYAYSHYDKVAVVTDDIVEPTAQISHRLDNIIVCHNVIDYKKILNNSIQPLTISKQTTVYPSVKSLMNILSSTNKIFINVGRFSPEKGQMRLLDAFSKIHEKHPDTKMIIVGGASYGNYYNKIVDHINDLKLSSDVILVKNLPNPFPLVKQCDYFVLSSFAEGFGLVIAEADVLGLPVISVDIPGPRNFINKYSGTLVPNNVSGLYDGMNKCLQGKISPMNIDYQKYNENAIAEFDKLF